MNDDIQFRLLGRRRRLEALRERLRARLRRPAATVKVSRPGDVALLRGLPADELRAFAESCRAHVVSRVGGKEFDFSFAGPEVPANT